MRKGQMQIFYETLIGIALLILVGFTVGLGGEVSKEKSETTIKDTTFAQHFDDYFLTLLQTPVPDSTAFPGSPLAIYESFDDKGYTIGDLLFYALEDKENKGNYLGAFRHYVTVTYSKVNSPHEPNLRISFPDGSVYHIGTSKVWQSNHPKTSYVLPYKKDETIFIEATGWLA